MYISIPYIITTYYYIFIIIILSGIHRYDSVFFITLSLSGRPENDLHYFDVEASPPAPCFAGLLVRQPRPLRQLWHSLRYNDGIIIV